MAEIHFMQEHLNGMFTNEDKTDYSEKNKCFIQSLKTMESFPFFSPKGIKQPLGVKLLFFQIGVKNMAETFQWVNNQKK